MTFYGYMMDNLATVEKWVGKDLLGLEHATILLLDNIQDERLLKEKLCQQSNLPGFADTVSFTSFTRRCLSYQRFIQTTSRSRNPDGEASWRSSGTYGMQP